MDIAQRNLDMVLLRTLVTIADSGSFSTAAQRLGRTQSAVSLQIKRLEEAVGQTLLLRSHGRVVGPSAEGVVLIGYGRRILRLNDEACSCFSRPDFSGRLRVGLPEEVMECAFPGVLADFSSACPRVELSVRCDLSFRLGELLAAGELDLAIGKRVAADAQTGPAGLCGNWRVLRREPLVWVGGEGSNAVDQQPLPIAVFHEGCVFRTAAIAALASRQMPWRAAFVGSSFTALRHAVAAGMALTPLPRSLLAAGLVEMRETLPPLPEAELLIGFAAGEVSAAARQLEKILERRL
jgi:DNA-binding transcriptional LysR family regulator